MNPCGGQLCRGHAVGEQRRDTGPVTVSAADRRTAAEEAWTALRPRIAELAVANPYANPRPVTRDGVEALLWAAWTGAPPTAGTPPVGRIHRTEQRSRT